MGNECSAKNLLEIYRTRLRMAKKGTINVRPELVAAMKRLVDGLSLRKSDSKIRLEMRNGKTQFIAEDDGSLIAEFDF